MKRDKVETFILDISAPDIKDIPLAIAAQLTEEDQAGYNAVSDVLKGPERLNHGPDPSPTTSLAISTTTVTIESDPTHEATSHDVDVLSEPERLSMWVQRHRWNGSGTLISPDLTGRQAIFLEKRNEYPSRQLPVVSRSSGKQAHFVRQERVRSGFCLCLGMLVGAVGAAMVL